LCGSNPRPMAHKTIALTTELRELVINVPPEKNTVLQLDAARMRESGHPWLRPSGFSRL
jgi:hypothetical protein